MAGDIKQEQEKAHYLGDLQKLGAPGVPETVKQIREVGACKFAETPYPHAKLEEWRQTNINEIIRTQFHTLVAPVEHGLSAADVAPHLLGDGQWTELVFVDGYFAKDLSTFAALPEGAVAGSLWDALLSTNPVAEEHLNKYLHDRNAFTHLNNAFLQDGAFVYLPKNSQTETPIHLVFLTTDKRGANTAANLRHLIVAGECAELTVVESYVSMAGALPYFNNVVVEIVCEANAKVERHKLVMEGAAGFHLATAEVSQQRDSRFESFTLSLQGKIIRNQLCIALDGEGAACNLHGLVTNDEDRLVDNAVNVSHSASNCSSRIAYKGVLDGTSKAVFLGKVHVHRDAQKTDSDQLSQYMLLSEKASIDTKPQLEIYADDVKCTHGATVGAPPEQVIFYFRSRGMDEATARGMLTYGFADEIVCEIGIAPLRDRVDKFVYDKYSPKSKQRQL
jgi:Fe-S cluster assembly protein SufD